MTLLTYWHSAFIIVCVWETWKMCKRRPRTKNGFTMNYLREIWCISGKDSAFESTLSTSVWWQFFDDKRRIVGKQLNYPLQLPQRVFENFEHLSHVKCIYFFALDAEYGTTWHPQTNGAGLFLSHFCIWSQGDFSGWCRRQILSMGYLLGLHVTSKVRAVRAY